MKNEAVEAVEFFTLGKEMGNTLSSKAFIKAYRLWCSLPPDERFRAQQMFYRGAEEAYVCKIHEIKNED